MSKVDLGQGYQGEPVDMKATGATGAYEELSRNDFSVQDMVNLYRPIYRMIRPRKIWLARLKMVGLLVN